MRKILRSLLLIHPHQEKKKEEKKRPRKTDPNKREGSRLLARPGRPWEHRSEGRENRDAVTARVFIYSASARFFLCAPKEKIGAKGKQRKQ